jgi:hypothetical protein
MLLQHFERAPLALPQGREGVVGWIAHSQNRKPRHRPPRAHVTEPCPRALATPALTSSEGLSRREGPDPSRTATAPRPMAWMAWSTGGAKWSERSQAKIDSCLDVKPRGRENRDRAVCLSHEQLDFSAPEHYALSALIDQILDHAAVQVP